MNISTPCIGICKLDPVSGLCVGCRRSREEIALWSSLPEERRLAIMAALSVREIPVYEEADEQDQEKAG